MSVNFVPQEVVARYLEPHRHYHTLEHIYNGLTVIDDLVASMTYLVPSDANIIKTAWWFHDAVYRPGRDDNEEQSALYAASLGFDERVQRLIRVTIYPTTKLLTEREAIIVDTDLKGLAAYPMVYDHHTAQIRQEFNMLSDEDFDIGRKSFLRRLIATQKPLFKTALGRELWENRAQVNIARELREW